MNLILLSGKAGAGKTTVQKIIEQQLTARGYVCQSANFADLVKYVSKSFCGWNGEKDDAGRLLLQTVGTDIVRAEDELYWIRFIKDMISFFGDVYDFMIVGDARFPNEIEYFKDGCEFGYIQNLDRVISVRIEREELTDCNISAENAKHSSETSLDNYEFDITVINKEGAPINCATEIVNYILEGAE